MKIVFLSHLDLNLYLFRLPVMKALLKNGHSVYAVFPKGEHSDAFIKEGIEVVHYPIIRNSLNPFKELYTIDTLKKLLREIDPDIVHSFTHKPNIYGAFSAPKHHIQTVTGLGSYFIDNSLKALFVRTIIENLYRQTAKKSDRVIFQNSDDMELFIKKRITPKSRARLVRSSGIDTKFFSPTKASDELRDIAKIEDDKPIVLMIARVILDKGVQEYIQASNLLKDKAHFLYIGDIDIGNKSAFNPNWGAVRYLGFKDDVKEWIALSDIVVLPSYREGVPRTLLEASSMGKALVATDVAGCREVVKENINGLLVPAKDYQALANAMNTLIEDKDMRKRFGEMSRKIALDEFDVQKVVEAYLAIYKEVLK